MEDNKLNIKNIITKLTGIINRQEMIINRKNASPDNTEKAIKIKNILIKSILELRELL